MRFVVTGTGRSGTRWASEVLGAGHQAIFTGDGVVMPDLDERARDHAAGKVLGDCSFWAASQDLTGWRVVLLVRDPWYVIGSWVSSGEFTQMLHRGYWRLLQHCHRLDPFILEAVGVERLARYWHAVNWRLAQTADVVMRVEDATPEALGDACGEVPFQDVPRPKTSTIPIEISSSYFPDGGRLAREFGYDC